MRKAFTLLAILAMAIPALFAQNDTIVETRATQSGISQQVVQSSASQQQSSVSQQQPAQSSISVQQTAKTQSSSGLYNGMRGTYITVRGIAPYRTMPTVDATSELYWPRFGVQVGAGEAYSFFTYEGVLEYMQTIHTLPDITEYINSLQGSVRLGGMVPIQLGSTFVLIPNIKAMLGGNFSFYGGWTTRFSTGLSGGIDFGFRIGGSKMITLGIVYEYRWYIDRTTTYGNDFLGGQIAFLI